MTNITNAKIVKAKSDIIKTKEKIAEFQGKLREQEKLLRHYEDLEIVAEYRRKMSGDEDLGNIFGNKQNEPAARESAAAVVEKEAFTDVNIEKE
ncbi:MAG: DUF4315 family protein [Oscillospiraceae bacterium]|jgi:hypothetical protein|nr:DUF4315 family protein [Oscillospiraceae bacterium]